MDPSTDIKLQEIQSDLAHSVSELIRTKNQIKEGNDEVAAYKLHRQINQLTESVNELEEVVDSTVTDQE